MLQLNRGSMLDVQNNGERFLIQGAVNLGNSLPQYAVGLRLHGSKSIWTNSWKKNLLGLLNARKTCLLAQ